jgi:hypothetical protein
MLCTDQDSPVNPYNSFVWAARSVWWEMRRQFRRLVDTDYREIPGLQLPNVGAADFTVGISWATAFVDMGVSSNSLFEHDYLRRNSSTFWKQRPDGFLIETSDGMFRASVWGTETDFSPARRNQ